MIEPAHSFTWRKTRWELLARTVLQRPYLPSEQIRDWQAQRNSWHDLCELFLVEMGEGMIASSFETVTNCAMWRRTIHFQ